MITARRKLVVQQDAFSLLIRLAQEGAPEEVCGLLVGSGSRVSHVLPVLNELHSPTRYRMEPREQLANFLWCEKQDLELLAIYHSHPCGPAEPSSTDIREFAYPGTISMIISQDNCGNYPGVLPDAGGPVDWLIRCYEIQDGAFSLVDIAVEGDHLPTSELE